MRMVQDNSPNQSLDEKEVLSLIDRMAKWALRDYTEKFEQNDWKIYDHEHGGKWNHPDAEEVFKVIAAIDAGANASQAIETVRNMSHEARSHVLSQTYNTGRNSAEKRRNIRTIEEIGDVGKWVPVVINIICGTPKFIVNILVGLFNAAGHMENLDSLWELPLVE